MLNNYLKYIFPYRKGLLILFPNNLLDYLIEYDDNHNLIILFFFFLALKRGPFPQISKNYADAPSLKQRCFCPGYINICKLKRSLKLLKYVYQNTKSKCFFGTQLSNKYLILTSDCSVLKRGQKFHLM